MLTVLNSAVQQQPRAAAVAKHVQLPSSRSQFRLRAIYDNDAAKASLAAELQALVGQVSNLTSTKALLHEPQLVDTVRALASGDIDKVTQYAGSKQVGLAALQYCLQAQLGKQSTLARLASTSACSTRTFSDA
jgi:hypothetical protein